MRWRRRTALAALIASAVVGALLLPGLIPDGHDDVGSLERADTSTIGASSLRARFALLSRRDSNQCGLGAESLETIAVDGRLQGSCCRPMDFHRYREQVLALRRYANVAEIPSDPYDIPVSLARTLLGHQDSIELTEPQQATYDRAMRLSDEGGPCCCRCWRWETFEGQAHFLIARRGYRAGEIAEIWELEDGCGGSAHSSHRVSG